MLSSKNPQQASQFLNLPPELRNHIYSYIACTEDPQLRSGYVSTPNLSLAGTCRQVHSELGAVFFTFLRERAEVIHVTVEDFDFGWLMRLVKLLQPCAEGAQRILRVKLTFSEPSGADLESLAGWQKLCSADPSIAHVQRQYTASFDWGRYDQVIAGDLEMFVWRDRGSRGEDCSIGLAIAAAKTERRWDQLHAQVAEMAEKEKHELIRDIEKEDVRREEKTARSLNKRRRGHTGDGRPSKTRRFR